ncbi:MAG: sulfotransferase [Rubrivivax sp.]|nr:sulfotransferase [Rubrivivax sp.]
MNAWPPHTLQLTRPLLRWLAADPQWRQLPLAWRTGATWRAAWGSLNTQLSARLSTAALGEGVALPPDPLLIVGPWRSGTTVMHELLVAATGGTTPQTWQCMNAAAFQLGGAPRTGVALARPMDGLEIRADSPQEDEFALLTLGVPSAYRAFLMPHRLDELADTLDPAFWLARPEWLLAWETFLRGVWRSTPSARAPLILKSPNHSFRLPSILERFPAARVLWMARPAADVFHSNRKMWQAMFATHGLTALGDAAALDRFLAIALQRAAELLRWCQRTLPPRQFSMAAQAKLRTDPEATTRAVLAALDLRADGQLEDTLARIRKGRVEQHGGATLPPCAEAACATLDEAQALALALQLTDA